MGWLAVGATLGLAGLALAALLAGGQARAQASPSEPSEEDIVAWIYYYADVYGADADELLRVGRCESGLSPYALGRLGEVGPFQFHPAGIWSSTPQARAGYSRWDPEANIAAASWAFSRQLQHHWTCWRLIYRGFGW